MEKNTRYLRNFIIAVILGTIIFIGIFFLGYILSYYNSQKLIQSQEDLRYELLSFEIQKNLLGDDCENFNPYLFSEKMDNLGRIIGILEQRLGENNPDILQQKKIYSLLETRHFLYIKENNENCPNEIPTILFFYSNEKNLKERAEEIGIMLSSLKNQEEVMVYSFDYNLDSNVIDILKQKYNINQPNMLVINEKAIINKFKNVNDIKEHIKN
ncbi:MAG: hypothetical protein ACOCUU_00255 [Nanoarchaeota archaeon]